MKYKRRLGQWMVVGGLIPSLIAAALPLGACVCAVSSPKAVLSPTESACCQSPQDANAKSSCCGRRDSLCNCCCEKEQESSCRGGDEAVPPPNPQFDGCECGAPAPPATAPSLTLMEVDLAAGMAMSLPAEVIPTPHGTRSLVRVRAVLLPPSDLPTTLCALLI